MEATTAVPGHTSESGGTSDNVAHPLKRFQCRGPDKPTAPKIPKVKELLTTREMPTMPPSTIMALIGCTDIVLGVDIETHDWESARGSKGTVGHFGFYTRHGSNDEDARIVQIGWATQLTSTGTIHVTERTVRPNGYAIAEKAAKYHGITQESAEQCGQPLHTVLTEFMDHAMRIDAMGVRIVIHHLEFDASIIARELERAGLGCMVEAWGWMARHGICTMDPVIGKWVRDHLGMEIAPFGTGNVMSLDTMLRGIVPDSSHLWVDRHTAGCDTHLHVLLCRALVKLAEAQTC